VRRIGVRLGNDAFSTFPSSRFPLIEKYRRYLREERDLANGSVRNMVPFVDRFLAQKYPGDLKRQLLGG
jgi:hypothetical protein